MQQEESATADIPAAVLDSVYVRDLVNYFYYVCGVSDPNEIRRLCIDVADRSRALSGVSNHRARIDGVLSALGLV
jgi:hypothetical protein